MTDVILLLLFTTSFLFLIIISAAILGVYEYVTQSDEKAVQKTSSSYKTNNYYSQWKKRV